MASTSQVDRAFRRMCSAFLMLALLNGCMVVTVDQPRPSGFAQIKVGKLDDGKDLIDILAVYSSDHHYESDVSLVITDISTHRLIRQLDHVHQLSLRQGNYLLDTWCNLPDAMEHALDEIYLDAVALTPISVQANQNYVLSCTTDSEHNTKYRLIHSNK